MPLQDPEINSSNAAFTDAMDAVYEQIDVARDSWAKFTEAGENLTKSFGDLKLNYSMSKGGNLIYVRNKPAAFKDIDSAMSDAGRLMTEFVASTQAAQERFNFALELALDGADTEHHGDALMSGEKTLESIVQQAAAAQQSWQSGLKEFMPQYRRFKLGATET